MAEQTEQAELDIDAQLEEMRQAEEAPVEEVKEPVREEGESQEAPPEEKPDTVPLGAFREIRDELKATRVREQGFQDTISKLEERLSKFDEALNPPPSFEDDPLGNLQHQTTEKFDKLSGDIGDLKEAISGNVEQTKLSNLQTRIENAEKQFTESHPDYPKAFQHIRDERLKQYQILGVPESEWENEAAGYIQRAIQSGLNPAEMVYNLAKEMGFQTEGKSEETKIETKSSLKDQARKLQAAKSLSGASGSQPKGEIEDMEADDVLSLSDSEFDKNFVGPSGEENWRKLFN